MTQGTPLRSSVEIAERGPSVLLPAMLVSDDQIVPEEILLIARDIAQATAMPDGLVALAEFLGDPRELDAARSNLLRCLDIPSSADVLEVGCGWGGLAEYLGARVHLVDAVDSDPARAWVAHSRTERLDAVRVFAARLDDIPVVEAYDLIVVGDSASLGWRASDPSRVLDDLRLLFSLLRDGGSLVIGSPNRLGVKYQAGGIDRGDDNFTDAPREGLIDERFSPRELERLLDEAEFLAQTRSVFPDHWAPRVVMDIEALAARAPSLMLGLPVFPSRDGQGAVPRVADERALWKSWIGSGLGNEVANSFQIIAGKRAPSTLWPVERLATYWSFGRRASQSSQNSVVLRDGSVRVERRHREPGVPRAEGRVHFRETDDTFRAGLDFVEVVAGAPALAEVKSLLDRWLGVVADQESTGAEILWDLVPHNLILEGSVLWVIDQEWVLTDGSWDVVRRRGIFWLASRLAESGAGASWLHGETISAVAVQLGALIGLPADGSWVDLFYEEESRAVLGISRPDARFTDEERVSMLGGHLRLTGDASWDISAHPPTLAERYRDLLRAADGEMTDTDARHLALVHRDEVVGLQAQLVTLRAELGELSSALSQARDDKELIVAELKASTSWRIGQFVVKPLYRFKHGFPKR